jgi:hypothetical protein
VDDPEWGADVSAVADPAPEDYLIERTVPLVPGTQDRVIPDPFEVFRRPRTEFTARVSGRLYERIYDSAGDYLEDRPVQGVRVTLRYDYAGEPSPYETLIDYTDAQGSYVFVVSWTDAQPGDYDDAGDVPPPAGGDSSIAAGEDGLLVDIGFEDAKVGDQTLPFSLDNPDYQDYPIYSSPRGGTNRLPDVFRSVP